MNIQEIYYKSDFTVILASEAQWGGCPFRLSFYTASPSRSFVACFDGENYHNCRLLQDGRLEIGINQKDGNVQSLMGIGKLMLAPEFYLDNDAFRDHVCNQFVKPFIPTFVKKDEDGNDVEYQVALSLNGASTFTTIGTLPAYYQAGLTPEEHQALLDATRDANAAAANADDTAEDVKKDVSDFLTLEGKNIREAIELVQKTGAAVKDIGNEAKAQGELAGQKATLADQNATLAGQKAQLADQKAQLADAKANLANEKAQLADQKATLANNAASAAYVAEDAANKAATAAKVAAKDAEKVNAQLNGTIVTITNRNGVSKSVDLGGNNVKYIVLNVDVDKPIDIDKPFVAVYYTSPSEWLQLPESWDTAEQTREVAGYRIDSFYHLKNDKRHGGHYTICKDKYIGEILVATKLMVRADNEWVDDLDGKTYDEWMEIITEAFGEIDIVDNLATEDPTKALSANQGKVLDTKLSELSAKVGEMEGTDAETIAEHLPVPDYNGNAVPTRFGQPWELYGASAPQEAVVPDNWRQFDMETGEGCNWNGLPLFIGQRYVNVLATSRALYIAVRTSYDKNNANYWSLKWLNI